jgi:cobalamin-dependent methionine synthase I
MSTLRAAFAGRVVVADGAIGTMLQASTATLDDFAGHEGCNEILNVTRHDIVTAIHETYLDAGAECLTTNTFNANFSALGSEIGAALAGFWHTRVRRELGLAADDPDDLDAFFRVAYRGARYSIGYPACPDLADRAKVARLLNPGRIGVELSEEMQLHPEQSTDALIAHHPQAKYFSV